jgi:hypothetical protein
LILGLFDPENPLLNGGCRLAITHERGKALHGRGKSQ